MSSRGAVPYSAPAAVSFMSAFVVACCLGGALWAAERWAAIAPNAENTAKVVWATSKDEAAKLAVLACKQSSSTCAETPASTNGMDNVFAVMCCEAPRAACAASVGADRASALNEVKTIFKNGGFTQCTLKSYFKAGTGEEG